MIKYSLAELRLLMLKLEGSHCAQVGRNLVGFFVPCEVGRGLAHCVLVASMIDWHQGKEQYQRATSCLIDGKTWSACSK